MHPRAHLVVRLKGNREDVGAHRVTLRWLNPNGDELWSTTGELNIGSPPAGVTELDLPLIAMIDLPIDRSGEYSLQIALDNQPRGTVPLQVRVGAPPLPRNSLVS
jgi:hypothetical protein